MKYLSCVFFLFSFLSTIYAQNLCQPCGDGSDGSYAPSSSETLPGGTYNFTSVNIPEGVVITVIGDQPLTIFCSGNIIINGSLQANGGHGSPGVTYTTFGTGGIGVAGGGNGGNGSYSESEGEISGSPGMGEGPGQEGLGWSGGGGAGHANLGGSSNGAGGNGGPAYGSSELTVSYAGSGGGGGSGGYSCGAGGGGAGGGMIHLYSCESLTIGSFGSIECKGGNGGSDGLGNCGGGGGGSGGTIYLYGSSVINDGILNVDGGIGGTSQVSGSPYFGAGGAGSSGRTLIQTEMEVCQGAALSFDGVDDVVTTPLPALFNNLATEDFTVETWVNISSSGFTQRLFFAQQDTANFTTALINISNIMYFYVNIDNIYYSTLAVPLPINQWTHVALRWTASTKTVEIFYDGILQNHNNGGISSEGNDNTFVIGGGSLVNQFYRGSLDEFRLWSEALTDQEIFSRRNCEIQDPYDGLLMNYHFNQGVASANNAGVTTLINSNGVNGTLENFALDGNTSNWIAPGAVTSGVACICETTFYQDLDGDGFGNPAVTQVACVQPTGFVSDNTDCNDNNAIEKPGQVWYKDTDGDNYAETSAAPIIQCLRPIDYKAATELISTTGDCDDNAASINPASTEVCDGIDNNCNSEIDEGVLITYYADNDEDGFGDPLSSIQACSIPPGYVTNNSDCDDNNAAINPGADEICNGIDDDCNGSIDDLGGSTQGNWVNDNIGNANGSSEYPPCEGGALDTFYIQSSGFGQPNNDTRHMVYQTLCGDMSISARILDIDGGGWAGISMQESLAPGSKKAALKTQLSNFIFREIRQSTGANQNMQMLNRPQHRWFKLERTGNTFTGYTSINGINWIFAFSANILMNNCIQIGLFAESNNNSNETSVKMDQVNISGGQNPLRPVENTFIANEHSITSALNVEIYPNPTNNYLHLRFNHSESISAKIKVLGLLGEMLMETKVDDISAADCGIELSDLPAGIYLLRVTTAENEMITKRIIKQ